jgi:hypothetical protein
MSVNIKCTTCSAALVDHKTFTAGGLVKESGKWCPVCKDFKVRDKVEGGGIVSEVEHPKMTLNDFDDAFAELLDTASDDLTIAELTGALELQLHIMKNRFTGYKQAPKD